MDNYLLILIPLINHHGCTQTGIKVHTIFKSRSNVVSNFQNIIYLFLVGLWQRNSEMYRHGLLHQKLKKRQSGRYRYQIEDMECHSSRRLQQSGLGIHKIKGNRNSLGWIVQCQCRFCSSIFGKCQIILKNCKSVFLQLVEIHSTFNCF